MRLLPLALAAVVSGAALAAPAAAAPATCTAHAANRGTCSYQSSGGSGTFACASTECTLYVNGYWADSLRLGQTSQFWTSLRDVVKVYAYDGGVATAGDNRRLPLGATR